jgi:hypothetical protein
MRVHELSEQRFAKTHLSPWMKKNQKISRSATGRLSRETRFIVLEAMTACLSAIWSSIQPDRSVI